MGERVRVHVPFANAPTAKSAAWWRVEIVSTTPYLEPEEEDPWQLLADGRDGVCGCARARVCVCVRVRACVCVCVRAYI